MATEDEGPMTMDERRAGTGIVRWFMHEMNRLGWRVEWARLYGAQQDSLVIVIPAESVDLERLAALPVSPPFSDTDVSRNRGEGESPLPPLERGAEV